MVKLWSQNYNLQRIMQTKRFVIVMGILTILMMIDAVEHIFVLGGSFTKSLWLSTFMASSVPDTGHFMANLVLGMFPVWILFGVGFVTINDFETGQPYNVSSRMGVVKYLQRQYLSNGIASMILFAVPLLVNLLTVWLISLLPITKEIGAQTALGQKFVQHLPEWQFLLWRLQHPAITFWLYAVMFLITVVLVGMLMVSLSLLFEKLYQLLIVVVLTTVLFGSQLYNMGELQQTFAQRIYVTDWISSYAILFLALISFNLAIYFWRKKGELA